MHLFNVLFSLICIQLISTVASDTNDASQSSAANTLIQSPSNFNHDDISNESDESDEAYMLARRSGEFLRFGRSQPAFLRFGRAAGQNGAAFLRFGRPDQQPASSNFLRFGRQTQPSASSNFLRFGRKGEFLRFG